MTTSVQTWLPLAITVFANIMLGLFVLVRKNDTTSRIFFLITITTSGWIITNYLADHAGSVATSTDWTKATFIFAFAITLALAFFSYNFPTRKQLSLLQNSFLLLPFVCVVALLIFDGAIIDHATPINSVGVVTFGSAYLLYFFCFIVYLILAVTRLIIAHIHSKGSIRTQTTFFLIGLVSGAAFATLTNLVLPLLFSVYRFTSVGGLSTTLFIGFTAYAIIAFHLFDIRFIISRAIIYSLLVSFSLALYGLTVSLITTLLGGETQNSTILASLITASALAFSFEPLRHWIAEKTDSWLFKKEYAEQEVTKKLSESLSAALGLDEGLDTVMRVLTETLHLNHAVTYVFQPGELGKQVITHSRHLGYTKPASLELNDKDFVVEYFVKHPDIALISALEGQTAQENEIIEGHAKGNHYLSAANLREHATRKLMLDKLCALDVAVAIPLQLHPNHLP